MADCGRAVAAIAAAWPAIRILDVPRLVANPPREPSDISRRGTERERCRAPASAALEAVALLYRIPTRSGVLAVLRAPTEYRAVDGRSRTVARGSMPFDADTLWAGDA